MRSKLVSSLIAVVALTASASAAARDVVWSLSVAAPGATVTIGAPAIAYGPVYQPAPQVVYPAPAYPVAPAYPMAPAYPAAVAPRVVYPAPAVPYGGWSAPVYRAGPPAWGYGGPVMVAPHGHWRHPRHHHHHRHHRH